MLPLTQQTLVSVKIVMPADFRWQCTRSWQLSAVMSWHVYGSYVLQPACQLCSHQTGQATARIYIH